MGTRDPRIDAYIEKSADFAQPILIHLREVVHSACPQVTETMKWGMPHFDYKGMMCGMAAFKQHATFGFMKEAMRLNDEGIIVAKPRKARKPDAIVPAELKAALAKNRQAAATFETFPPSHRREYVEWIAEAKRDETKAKRVTQAVEWMAEGKSRNWKYER